MPDRTSPDWPAQLERGIAERALPGESRSGDCGVFVTRADGALVAAIDGLGHGGEAADAAGLAADVLVRHPDDEPAALLERCHAALRRSRGAVVGYNLPDTRVTSTALRDGDVIVMITDGVDSNFAEAVARGGTAQQIADRILAAHARDADDALVVVVRYRSTLGRR